MLQHEISEGFVRQVGRNYYMILTVDGQRRQRKTGTSDKMAALDMLEEWKTQAKMGLREDTRVRYEAMRDEYIQKGGKKPDQHVLNDLDVFFKGMRVAAIDVTHWSDSVHGARTRPRFWSISRSPSKKKQRGD